MEIVGEYRRSTHGLASSWASRASRTAAWAAEGVRVVTMVLSEASSTNGQRPEWAGQQVDSTTDSAAQQILGHLRSIH